LRTIFDKAVFFNLSEPTALGRTKVSPLPTKKARRRIPLASLFP